MPNTFDVVVVGAGIVGTFHAYFAAQRGLKTLLVDRDPAPRQATVRNFGMIVTGTIAAPGEWDGFARRTNELYRQLGDESEKDLTIRPRGSLYVVETELEDRVIREFADLSSSLGKRAEYLSAADMTKSYAFVDPEYARGGLLFPDDMSVDPRRFIHLILEQLSRRESFTFKPDTCVVGIEAEAGGCKVTDSSGNQHSCGRVVVCSGIEYRIFGGIHLTGVRRDPHQCSAADRHGRFAPGRSRLGGQLPRPSAGNEILETHRLVGHGQLEHAIKHHAAAAGAAAIEAEHELVEVVAHVGTVGGPLMRSQQPPLGQ